MTSQASKESKTYTYNGMEWYGSGDARWTVYRGLYLRVGVYTHDDGTMRVVVSVGAPYRKDAPLMFVEVVPPYRAQLTGKHGVEDYYDAYCRQAVQSSDIIGYAADAMEKARLGDPSALTVESILKALAESPEST